MPCRFNLNHSHHYIPFHITNTEGREVPAKYIKVKMTSDPFAYGMLSSTSLIFKGFVHAAPILDVDDVPKFYYDEQLKSLQADYVNATQVNDSLGCIQDWSLVAEVHHY